MIGHRWEVWSVPGEQYSLSQPQLEGRFTNRAAAREHAAWLRRHPSTTDTDGQVWIRDRGRNYTAR